MTERRLEVTDQPRPGDPDTGRFVITVDGREAGHLDYRVTGGVAVLPHTEVDPAHEGQGIGSALVRESLAAIRERGLQVEPRCWFVARWIERHPDHADLVAS